MDVSNRGKENGEVFHCIDIAQIKIEIFGISRSQILNIKKSLVQLLIEEENPSTLTIFSKDPCLV